MDTKTLPKFETIISLKEDTLQIEYAIENITTQNIYIFNMIWEMDNTGKPFLDSHRVYSSFREDKTLVLGKQICPLPKTKRVEFRYIPYVTKIKAGEKFSEKINLPLPIEEFNPYFPKMSNSETELVMTENITFNLDYISEIEGLEINKTTIENAFSVWHKDLFGNVVTLSAVPKTLSVKVNYRKDRFERF